MTRLEAWPNTSLVRILNNHCGAQECRNVGMFGCGVYVEEMMMRCESEVITLCSQSCGCEKQVRRVTEDVLKEAGGVRGGTGP